MATEVHSKPPEQIYKEALPSVLTLLVDKKDGTHTQGSAFLAFDHGLAVTAWHVVEGAKRVVARFATEEEFEVSGIVDKDEKRDLAIIRVKVYGRPLMKMVVEEPQVGTAAYVIGTPQGLESSMSDGIVSQIRTFEGVKVYQFTCPASAGNSGGPLVNGDGEVSGIVSFQSRERQNLNFAIPTTYALGLDRSLPTQKWVSLTSYGAEIGKDDMVLIPSGSFQMGSSSADRNERPIHAVELDSFYIDKQAVTVAQYQEHDPNYRPSEYSSCRKCPATLLSWNDAKVYCLSLGKRLPTEAEWERACRCPDLFKWSWGNSPDNSKAHYGVDRTAGSVPVSSYDGHGFGTYNMSGNVYEWVNDFYDKNYYRNSPSSNPKGPENKSRRVKRGGSWPKDAKGVRCAKRYRSRPGERWGKNGFRCAK